jgi:hypothetical protein
LTQTVFSSRLDSHECHTKLWNPHAIERLVCPLPEYDRRHLQTSYFSKKNQMKLHDKRVRTAGFGISMPATMTKLVGTNADMRKGRGTGSPVSSAGSEQKIYPKTN